MSSEYRVPFTVSFAVPAKVYTNLGLQFRPGSTAAETRERQQPECVMRRGSLPLRVAAVILCGPALVQAFIAGPVTALAVTGRPQACAGAARSLLRLPLLRLDGAPSASVPRGRGGRSGARGGRSSGPRGGRGMQRGRKGGRGVPRSNRRAPHETFVLAYHKRRGLVTTHNDELGRETVYQDLAKTLPPHLKREHWHAIGRLDADTTGLLLMTNDGALVHHATQPGSKLPKAYHALCKGLLRDEQIDALRHGVELTGGLGISAPAEVDVLRYETATTWLGITISEGKNRQIRRMLLAIDSQVIRLERVSVGAITLDGIEEGGWRCLTDAEVLRGLQYQPRNA